MSEPAKGRVGILGGTFNPIHYGHLRPAEEVCEALGLEEVRLIPLAQPAHKEEGEIAPAEDRFEMVRLACEDNPRFVSDPIEIERGGVSYTIDTLCALQAGPCRGKETFFIIGADAFAELHIWRAPLELLEVTNFAVTLRMGQSAEEVLRTLKERLAPFRPGGISFESTGDSEFQFVDSKKVINFVPITHFEISGTDIRARARAGGSLRYLLPSPVELFIICRGLFGSPKPGPR
ncbi:MAG: nicotinate-nucleotide adenylyltransferase [bacterium]|nr:nicotinate-nucleotide adenylyltransferase [bacterium]